MPEDARTAHPNTHADTRPDTHAALPAPHEMKALPAHASASSTGGGGPRKKGGFPTRLVLILLLIAAAAYFIFRRVQGNKQEAAQAAQKAAQAANRPTPVAVTAVESRTMPIYLSALGTVTAYNTVTIKSRVDGQLLTVAVREGQQVRQGQVLATIDPRPYQAVVAQAEGQLARDEAAAANAKAEAGRYAALYQAGVISKESAQTQQATYGQSAGTLIADRAAIQAAKVNVAYTRITSPINGVVGLRQVDAGNIVKAADANGLLVVTQLQPIAVVFTMPEDQVPQVLKRIRSGEKLAVQAYDRSDAHVLATGTLLTLDNQIDTTTGTVKAKAVFNNADGQLFPNQFVNVRLVLEQRQNSIVLPAAALQTGNAGTFVYVVKPGTPPHPAGKGGSAKGGDQPAPAASESSSKSASKGDDGAPAGPPRPKFYVDVAPVVVDLTEGALVILKSGVNPGDMVVIDGQEKLKKYGMVIPQQGRSNAGGPSHQTIGTDSTTDRTTPGGDGTPASVQKKPNAPGKSSASPAAGNGQQP